MARDQLTITTINYTQFILEGEAPYYARDPGIESQGSIYFLLISSSTVTTIKQLLNFFTTHMLRHTLGDGALLG